MSHRLPLSPSISHHLPPCPYVHAGEAASASSTAAGTDATDLDADVAAVAEASAADGSSAATPPHAHREMTGDPGEMTRDGSSAATPPHPAPEAALPSSLPSAPPSAMLESLTLDAAATATASSSARSAPAASSATSAATMAATVVSGAEADDRRVHAHREMTGDAGEMAGDDAEVDDRRVRTLADVGNLTGREEAPLFTITAGREEAPESTIGGETTCIVCFVNPKSHIAVPCGHVCACGSCSARMELCPYCREPVAMWVQTRVV